MFEFHCHTHTPLLFACGLKRWNYCDKERDLSGESGSREFYGFFFGFLKTSFFYQKLNKSWGNLKKFDESLSKKYKKF